MKARSKRREEAPSGKKSAISLEKQITAKESITFSGASPVCLVSYQLSRGFDKFCKLTEEFSSVKNKAATVPACPLSFAVVSQNEASYQSSAALHFSVLHQE